MFNLKLDRLVREIKDIGIFGRGNPLYAAKPAAIIHVVEFQKRGLPHAHILVILRPDDKPRTVEDIDKIVCCEIPPATIATADGGVRENPLFDIVRGNMMHGPCGMMNPKCPCMRDGKCSKGYPKEF